MSFPFSRIHTRFLKKDYDSLMCCVYGSNWYYTAFEMPNVIGFQETVINHRSGKN